MRIAIDAMGGDFAPEAPVLGAILYLKETHGRDELILTGDESAIEKVLNRYRNPYADKISVVHTTEVITMDDSPTAAVRKKKDSSMVRGIRMHRDKEVDAFISAGSTGAQMAASLFNLGRIKGVSRPGLGAYMPYEKGVILFIDVGANADCKPINLLQFGLMGRIFMELNGTAENPKIGLLNIGEEKSKGNELAVAAHEMMAKHLPSFIGNVEGRDMLHGKADVIVTDGFTGNVVLKFAEGFAGVLGRTLNHRIRQNLLSMAGAILIKPAFRAIKRKFDYEEYGGVPLLGIDGICIKCHGSSTSKAIKNAIHVARKMAMAKVNERIYEEIKSKGLEWGEKQLLQA